MAHASALPTENNISISEKDKREILDMYQKLLTSDAKLVGPDGKVTVLPNSLYSFLCTLLAELKAGYSVTVLQTNAALTTTEAAKLLGVSRQFLVRLLEKEEIPFYLVGTHRRLFARDVFAYKAKRDSARAKALDDLARAEYEDGIYDRMPDDSEPK